MAVVRMWEVAVWESLEENHVRMCKKMIGVNHGWPATMNRLQLLIVSCKNIQHRVSAGMSHVQLQHYVATGTHHDKAYEQDETLGTEPDYKRRTRKKCHQFVETPRSFRNDPVDSNQGSTTSDESGSQEHSWAKEKASKKGVPKERNGAQGCQYDDRKGCYLYERSKYIRCQKDS